jgi:hypothetical protein
MGSLQRYEIIGAVVLLLVSITDRTSGHHWDHYASSLWEILTFYMTINISPQIYLTVVAERHVPLTGSSPTCLRASRLILYVIQRSLRR